MSVLNGVIIDVIDCGNCGRFKLEVDNVSLPPDSKSLAKLSHAVKKAQGEKPFDITADFVEEVSKRELPTVVEQADNLILWFGENTLPGKPATVTPETHQALMGAVDRDGVKYVLTCTFSNVWAMLQGTSPTTVGAPSNGYGCVGELSAKGWQRYEGLRRGTVQSRKAFMAMQFGDKELDGVFESCFIPAVKQTGFELERVNTNPKAGLIDDKIRVDIRNARFVIADLTHENRGAYWEAGFAEGLGKPVIYTCKKEHFEEHKTHFDTNHHTTIVWDKDNLDKAAKDLQATIRATLPGEAK